MPTVAGVNDAILAILADQGAVTATAHPRLRSSLERLARRGLLANPLPGTYLSASDVSHRTWLRAVCAWSAPDGVLHGATAASLWMPESSAFPTVPRTTMLAHPRLRSRGRITVTRRVIPREFVRSVDGLRFTSPAFAAVELAATDDGRAICEALRLGLADLPELEAALQSLSRSEGQAARRPVVHACLLRPWSYAELRLQRILTAQGITGWVGNVTLRVGGELVHPDVLFDDAKLIIEFDGRATHDNPAQYLKDRERLNRLAAHGYIVLRFGWEHLDQPDYVARTVRQALGTQNVGA